MGEQNVDLDIYDEVYPTGIPFDVPSGSCSTMLLHFNGQRNLMVCPHGKEIMQRTLSIVNVIKC
jgi:hypothetical protein